MGFVIKHGSHRNNRLNYDEMYLTSMTLTKNEKIAAGVGAAIVIVAGIGAAVAASKAKAAVTPPSPTAPAITISVTPTRLPASGGEITISGTAKNISADAVIMVYLNGTMTTVGQQLLGRSIFSLNYYDFFNAGNSTETIDVQVGTPANSAVMVMSNTIAVTVAGQPLTAPTCVISVTPTSLPSSGGNVTVNGTVRNMPVGTLISISAAKYPYSYLSDAIGTIYNIPLNSDGTFSHAFPIPANRSVGFSAESIVIQALAFPPSGYTVSSNGVNITVAPSTAPFLITASVSPTELLPSGGTINISGILTVNPANPSCLQICVNQSSTMTQEAYAECLMKCITTADVSVSLLLNGKTIYNYTQPDMQPAGSSIVFSHSFGIAASTGASAETLDVQVVATVEGVTLKSNVVTVEVAGTSTPTVAISVAPIHISPSGGTITISGTTRNIPTNTVGALFINGLPIAGTAMVLNSDGTFSGTFKVSANTFYYSVPIDVQVWVRIPGNGEVKSNIVDATLEGLPVPGVITISVSPTSMPSGGGEITISGTAKDLPEGTDSVGICIGGRPLEYNNFCPTTVPLNSDGTFSGTLSVPANPADYTITWYAEATILYRQYDAVLDSNVVTVEVAGTA